MDYVARPHWSAYWINAEYSDVVISVSNNIRTRRIGIVKHGDQAGKFCQDGGSTEENEGNYFLASSLSFLSYASQFYIIVSHLLVYGDTQEHVSNV